MDAPEPNSLRNGILPIEILSSTFPIIGCRSPEQRAEVERERAVANTDLAKTFVGASVRYHTPFPVNDDGSDGENILKPEKIRIHRDGEKIIFEAVGTVQQQDTEEKFRYHDTSDERVLAQATFSIAKFLRVAKAYIQDRNATERQIKDLESVGHISGVEEIDTRSKALHLELALALQKELESGPLKFGRVDRENLVGQRYLVTALLMHLLPGSAFENLPFLKGDVHVQHELRRSVRHLEP